MSRSTPGRCRTTASRAAPPGLKVLAVVLPIGLLLAAQDVAAYAEGEAANLRMDVVRAGHEPPDVPPHTQWSGFLTLTPASNVTAASYQVCRVGAVCFAPPAPAGRIGDTFRFDTTQVPANAVDYQAGWNVGVRWILTARDGTQEKFPQGPDLLSPECQGAASMSCQEKQYLTFFIGEEPARPSPLPAQPLVALAVLAAGLLHLRFRRNA